MKIELQGATAIVEILKATLLLDLFKGFLRIVPVHGCSNNLTHFPAVLHLTVVNRNVPAATQS